MKPTQKEIDYFMHPDQAWLQKLWNPAVGDWALAFPKSVLGSVMGLVVEINVTRWKHTALRLGDGTERDFNHRIQLCWLPSLGDLLGMIEEAGWRISNARQSLKRGKVWYWLQANRTDRALVEIGPDTVEGGGISWELAAAELLRRLRDGFSG